MRSAICLVAIVLSAAACGAPPPPPVTAPGDPAAPAPAQLPAEPDLAGSWSSAGCGGRAYERRIELRADGTFSAEDLVSPCPPGARCVWSGVVVRRGTWKMQKAAIALTAEPVTGPAPGAPFPTELAIDAGAPVEMGSAGARCAYQRLK